MERTAHPWEGSRRLVAVGAIIGAVGLVAWVVGLLVDSRQALFSYLTAYIYVLTTVLGALIFLMSVHASQAEWPVAFRPLIERIVALLPALTVLFLPIAIGIHRIYAWAGAVPAGTHLSDVMTHQALYLNVPFALLRAFLFLGLWALMGGLLIHWSHRVEETGELRWKTRQWRLSGIGLVIVALSLTFFAIDWIMSLTPTWISTIFGFYVFSGGFVAAFALIVVLMTAAQRAGPLQGILRGGHFLSMGKLELAFIIFWTYMTYAQYLIVWIADIPHEASWFQTRSEGWGWVSILLILTHFAVPFFILLWRDMKRWPTYLSAISIWILAVHYVDIYWLIMPALHLDRPHPHWLDLATLLLVIGTCLAIGSWQTKGKVLVPLRDPDLPVALRYEGS